jgi:hypothetical protein
MKIWYVKFPTDMYVENVKEVAKANGLKIIDAKFQEDNKQCDNAPKLTVIGEVVVPKIEIKKTTVRKTK